MNKVLYIILISFFSLTIISCAKKSDTSSTTSSGLFVAVGNSGTLLTSSDGTSWTDRSFSGGSQNEYLKKVTYGNNNFVVTIQDNKIWNSSNNGVTWDSHTTNNDDVIGITYGNGTFVGVGQGGAITTATTNLNSWTSRTSGSTSNFDDVIYANSIFMAVGGSGTILTSSDNGTSWTSRTSGTTNALYGVTYKE